MMYKKPDQRVIDLYTEGYNKAKKLGKLKECLVGENKEYRIISRDSYYLTITDSNVLLANVVYPAFLDGNSNIENEIKKNLIEMAESEQPLEFFQACCYYNSEILLEKYYEGVPVKLFDKALVEKLRDRLPQMKESLVNYRSGEFGKYIVSIYEIAKAILAE